MLTSSLIASWGTLTLPGKPGTAHASAALRSESGGGGRKGRAAPGAVLWHWRPASLCFQKDVVLPCSSCYCRYSPSATCLKGTILSFVKNGLCVALGLKHLNLVHVSIASYGHWPCWELGAGAWGQQGPVLALRAQRGRNRSSPHTSPEVQEHVGHQSPGKASRIWKQDILMMGLKTRMVVGEKESISGKQQDVPGNRVAAGEVCLERPLQPRGPCHQAMSLDPAPPPVNKGSQQTVQAMGVTSWPGREGQCHWHRAPGAWVQGFETGAWEPPSPPLRSCRWQCPKVASPLGEPQ